MPRAVQSPFPHGHSRGNPTERTKRLGELIIMPPSGGACGRSSGNGPREAGRSLSGRKGKRKLADVSQVERRSEGPLLGCGSRSRAPSQRGAQMRRPPQRVKSFKNVPVLTPGSPGCSRRRSPAGECLRPPRAVVGEGEPVGLVPDPHQEKEDRVVRGEDHRVFPPGKEDPLVGYRPSAPGALLGER